MLKDKEDPDYEGDKSYFMNYKMSRQQVTDSFNVLTNHHLKEMYDRHNVFVSEEDFVKVKMKSFSMIEKYIYTAKALLFFLPFFFLQFIILPSHS